MGLDGLRKKTQGCMEKERKVVLGGIGGKKLNLTKIYCMELIQLKILYLNM